MIRGVKRGGPHRSERSELVVMPGLTEKLKHLKMARQKEMEAMRDRY